MLVPSLRTNVLPMPEFKETPEQILSEINISKGLSLRLKNKAELPIAEGSFQIRDDLGAKETAEHLNREKKPSPARNPAALVWRDSAAGNGDRPRGRRDPASGETDPRPVRARVRAFEGGVTWAS